MKRCQSQEDSLQATMANIREAIGPYLETLPGKERWPPDETNFSEIIRRQCDGDSGSIQAAYRMTSNSAEASTSARSWSTRAIVVFSPH